MGSRSKTKMGGEGGGQGQVRVAIQSNKGAYVAIHSICMSSWGGGWEGMPHPPHTHTKTPVQQLHF